MLEFSTTKPEFLDLWDEINNEPKFNEAPNPKAIRAMVHMILSLSSNFIAAKTTVLDYVAGKTTYPALVEGVVNAISTKFNVELAPGGDYPRLNESKSVLIPDGVPEQLYKALLSILYRHGESNSANLLSMLDNYITLNDKDVQQLNELICLRKNLVLSPITAAMRASDLLNDDLFRTFVHPYDEANPGDPVWVSTKSGMTLILKDMLVNAAANDEKFIVAPLFQHTDLKREAGK